MISIVVPCYNEEKVLTLFYESISQISSEISNEQFEFIFVDDGSKDDTLNILRNFNKKDSRVKYISFSRNFGKEAGMLAGLNYASGNYVAIMDADMQHPPWLLPQMYNKLYKSAECDCVAAYRITREGESKTRSFLSRCFYKLINKISEVELIDGVGDFRIMKRNVVDAILSTKEYNRFSKGLFAWVGFKIEYIEFNNIERVSGSTKWSFLNLFKYSIDGIVAFSTVPLVIASFMGTLFCLISIIISLIFLIKVLIWGEVVAGFPTLICTILFLGGIQLFCIGILGQYVSKTYMETKGRPVYIVKEFSK